MNWVGGARTRVKTKDDKKKQQEFFEKKRFESKLVTCNKTESHDVKKDQPSQDLVFIRTLMNENPNKTKKMSPSVVHINFENPKSSNCSFQCRHNKVELSESPEIKSNRNKQTLVNSRHENVLKPLFEVMNESHPTKDFPIQNTRKTSECGDIQEINGHCKQTVIFEHIYDSFSLTQREEPLYHPPMENVQFLKDDFFQMNEKRHPEWVTEEATEIEEEFEEVIDNQSESLKSSQNDISPLPPSKFNTILTVLLSDDDDDGSPKNKTSKLKRSSSCDREELFRKKMCVVDVETQTEIVQICDGTTQT